MSRLAPIASENPHNPITWDTLAKTSTPLDMTPFYEILEISEGFTKEDLEKAYKKALIKYHPDGPNGDKDRFEQVTEAYLLIKDIKESYERTIGLSKLFLHK